MFPVSMSHHTSALASLPGLSLAEARQLLHLISSLQAAGSVAHPSTAVCVQAAAVEQLVKPHAIFAEAGPIARVADNMHRPGLQEQQQVQ